MLALTAVGAIGGLTVVLASLLVLANKKLYVEEDPRIDVVEEMLPHANCGACGLPGCRPFAEALVQGDVLPGKCTVSPEEGRAQIADFLGVDVGAEEKQVARVACAGGTNVARNHARYHGPGTCRAAAQVAGGGKGCFWGCLGLDDCYEVCDFDAIRMSEHALPVIDEEKCTACGDCVEACPKDLIALHPVSHRLWVACSSREAGDELLDDCEVACTACARCEMDAPGGLISMRGNLPIVDYDRNHASRAPIQRCPTGAIVWIDPKAGPVKGPAAKKIIRKGALRDAPT
jgi:Na+-translocating ferredoxin:NAD+ oxidoreductase RNF subunit RnfB